MEQIIYNEILPPLIFFAIFSIVFSLLELIVIFFLNRLGRRHWEFMIDVVIRSKVHHGKLIKGIVLIIIAILVAWILLLTPLMEVVMSATQELKLLALLLALVMFLIYSINIRKAVRLDIEKKIYKTIFLIISLILYTFILILANKSYGRYVQYVSTQFVEPTVKGIETVIAEQEEKQLLEKFRQSYLNDECVTIDYTQIKEDRKVRNFVFIKSEPELAYGESYIDREEPTTFLKGKACSDEENTFLLTEQGDWYWVIDESF